MTNARSKNPAGKSKGAQKAYPPARKMPAQDDSGSNDGDGGGKKPPRETGKKLPDDYFGTTNLHLFMLKRHYFC